MRKSRVVCGGWLLVSLLAAVSARAQTNEDAVRRIAAEIGQLCTSKGMLACEKNFRGVDEMFEVFHEYERLGRVEATFAQFVKSRYPAEKFDWSLMDASLKLKINFEIAPDRFTKDMRSATKIADGYHITNGKGQEFDLRQDSNGWYIEPGAAAIAEMRAGLEQVAPYYTAAVLKHRILLYRAFEADMAKLDKATLEANVSGDLAPIVARLLGPEKVPESTRASLKPLNDVLDFYRSMDSREKMEASIRAAHGLAPTVSSSL